MNRIGLIGKSLSHSYSKIIHEMISNDHYNLYSFDSNELKNFLEKKDFDFVNITIPYKEEVMSYLDILDDVAKEIGSVNTIINKNGILVGYNTDYLGFAYLLDKNNINVENKNCLILGTGGTSKTINYVLNAKKAKSINKVSRNKKNDYLCYGDLNNILYTKEINIIVNTTPCGMYPNLEEKLIDLNNFPNLEAYVDVIYNPINPFLVQEARNINIKTTSGLEMLIVQALEARKIFDYIEYDNMTIETILKSLLFEKQNIVLIGLPSSGKSSIAKLLGEKINKRVYDIDQLIEENEKMSIKEIFTKFGEEYFRLKETNMIKVVTMLNNIIISTGGGSVLKDNNMKYLKANGIVFYINRDINKIAIDDTRPLSKNIGDYFHLYMQRRSLYLKYMDYEIFNNNSIDEAVLSIERKVQK